jgi:hypothetical protein
MLAVEEEVVAVTEDIKMADAELIDGTVVYTEGEMVVGATLLVRVDEGEESPYAPEGLHETTDGMIVAVGPNGEIMDITEKAADAVTEEEVIEDFDEVAVVAEVPEEAVAPTEDLLAGIAELITPFTEEIATLNEEITALKARFNKIAGEPAASPIRNTFSETKLAKKNMEAQRMDALRAIRNSK